MASDVCSLSKSPDETEVVLGRATVTPDLLSAAQCSGKVREEDSRFQELGSQPQPGTG